MVSLIPVVCTGEAVVELYTMNLGSNHLRTTVLKAGIVVILLLLLLLLF